MATGKGNAYAHELLVQQFQRIPIAGHGDYYYLSLHTSDPGPDGVQTTNEVAYPGYQRLTIARTPAGFTVLGNTVSLTQVATFPAGLGEDDGPRCSFACIGRDAAGDGEILYRGQLSQKVATGGGISPQLNTTTGFTES